MHICGVQQIKKKSRGGVEGGGELLWLNHMLHHNLKLLKVTHSLALCSPRVLTPLCFSARRLLLSGLIGPKTPSRLFATHTHPPSFSSSPTSSPSSFFFFFKWRSGTDCNAVCQALANVLFSLHQRHKHTPKQTHTTDTDTNLHDHIHPDWSWEAAAAHRCTRSAREMPN